MKVLINYSLYGIELDLPTNATREQQINALLIAFGGPQLLLDHFIRHFRVIEDFIPDIELTADVKETLPETTE